MSLHEMTLTELSAGLSAGKFSSREIVDALLGRIAKADGKLHSFVEVYSREAKDLADAADKALARLSGEWELLGIHGPTGIRLGCAMLQPRMGAG